MVASPKLEAGTRRTRSDSVGHEWRDELQRRSEKLRSQCTVLDLALCDPHGARKTMNGSDDAGDDRESNNQRVRQ